MAGASAVVIDHIRRVRQKKRGISGAFRIVLPALGVKSWNYFYFLSYVLKINLALAAVAQWIECWPTNQRVASSMPSQGNAWGAGQVPSRGMPEATN